MILTSPIKYPKRSSATITQTVNALDLTFTKKTESRQIDILSPKFTDLRASFNTQVFDLTQVQNSGTLTYGNGVLSFSNGGFFQIKSAATLKVPHCVSILEINSMGGGTSDTVEVGVMKDLNNYCGFYYDNNLNQINSEVKVGGTQTLGVVSALDITAPFKLAFVLNDKWISCLYKTNNSQWIYLRGFDVSSFIDFRVESTIKQYSYFFFGACNTGSQVFNNFEGGLFGSTGFNDLAIIHDENGTPLTKDGKTWVTYDCGGISDTGTAVLKTPASHWAVGLLDIETGFIEETAKIFSLRNGNIKSDRAGRIIYDSLTGTWNILLPTWGDYTGSQSVLTNLYTTQVDPRYGLNILESPTTLSLGPTSAYDTDAVKINGLWNIAFASTNTLTGFSNFYPGLVTSTSISGNYTTVGIDSSANSNREGTTFWKVGGTVTLATTSNSGNPIRIYELSSLTEIGSISMSSPSGFNGYFAWPTLIYSMKNNKTYYKWISFADRLWSGLPQAFGNIFIFTSNESNQGYEFPIFIDCNLP